MYNWGQDAKAPLLKKGGVGGGCISVRRSLKPHYHLLQRRKFIKIESINPTNPNSDKNRVQTKMNNRIM